MSEYGIARDVLDAVGVEKFLQMLNGWSTDEVWGFLAGSQDCSVGCWEDGHLYLKVEADWDDNIEKIEVIGSEYEFDRFFGIDIGGAVYDLGPVPVRIEKLKIGSYFTAFNAEGLVNSVGRKAASNLWYVDGIDVGHTNEDVREWVSGIGSSVKFFGPEGKEVGVA